MSFERGGKIEDGDSSDVSWSWVGDGSPFVVGCSWVLLSGMRALNSPSMASNFRFFDGGGADTASHLACVGCVIPG